MELYFIIPHNCIVPSSLKKKTFPDIFKGIISFLHNKHVGVRAKGKRIT